MEKKNITEKEWELIEAIRNFKRLKSNYSFQYELYLRELFENILRELD